MRLRLPNALVQLQAQHNHCGEAASENCLSAATIVRRLGNNQERAASATRAISSNCSLWHTWGALITVPIQCFQARREVTSVPRPHGRSGSCLPPHIGVVLRRHGHVQIGSDQTTGPACAGVGEVPPALVLREYHREVHLLVRASTTLAQRTEPLHRPSEA